MNSVIPPMRHLMDNDFSEQARLWDKKDPDVFRLGRSTFRHGWCAMWAKLLHPVSHWNVFELAAIALVTRHQIEDAEVHIDG